MSGESGVPGAGPSPRGGAARRRLPAQVRQRPLERRLRPLLAAVPPPPLRQRQPVPAHHFEIDYVKLLFLLLVTINPSAMTSMPAFSEMLGNRTGESF